MANERLASIAAGAGGSDCCGACALLRNTGPQFEFEAAPPPPESRVALAMDQSSCRLLFGRMIERGDRLAALSHDFG
jgi:hypothetical protein